jgi:hypothetical protein
MITFGTISFRGRLLQLINWRIHFQEVDMKTRFFFLTALLALTFPFISHAQIPRTLSYQGVLTDNTGKPRPDANYSITLEKLS